MPVSLRRRTVSAVTERHPGLIRIEVDGIACIVYPRLTGEVEVGDDVLVNEQARLLELGSGGFGGLYADLAPARGRRRCALERAGPAARARVRRLRRPLREPDPRAGAPARAGRARDLAAVHA